MANRRELGCQFAPEVEVNVCKWEYSFSGNISIGDFYYEADQYELEDGVKEELIGCLEKIKEQIEVELKKLKGE